MKKVLALLIAAFIFAPISSTAGEAQREAYWFCYQVGTVEVESESKGKGKKRKRVQEVSTLVISNVFYDDMPNHYDDREEQFAEAVEEDTEGTFHGQFEAQCLDSGDAKRATKHRMKKIERAENRGYEIWPIQFVYEPPEEE